MKLLRQFQNFFAILLLVGGIFCFIAYALSSDDDTNLYLGVVLMLVVFITATFSFLQVRTALSVSVVKMYFLAGSEIRENHGRLQESDPEEVPSTQRRDNADYRCGGPRSG